MDPFDGRIDYVEVLDAEGSLVAYWPPTEGEATPPCEYHDQDE